MAKVTGFLEAGRAKQPYRPVTERLKDWKQVMAEYPPAHLNTQAARCMDCGIPFCHQGCPLGNLIPDWNDLVWRGRWHDAIDRLHATNNFPEFTGTLCPAPCEGSCVLGINDDPVTIKAVELAIIDRAFDEGWVKPEPPKVETGKRVAVIGSGPAGLAAAQQLRRAGHAVTVFERDDRIGGLLRYGIPEFKMEKRVLDRRLEQMRVEGVEFRVNANVGVNLKASDLQREYDVLLLTGGATVSRDLPVPGRDLDGIHLAMEFLPLQNRKCEGDEIPEAEFISAQDKHVVIIGGGDTGADCLGTAHRQGAASVTQLDYNPEPPEYRDDSRTPWPMWPIVLRTRLSPAHAEGGDRRYQVAVQRFLGDDEGNLRALEIAEVKVERDEAGRRRISPVGDSLQIPCELALLAIGFEGVERMALLDGLGIELNRRGAVPCGSDWQTDAPGVFVCGDAHRGASLIVWAIAEGRAAAHAVDTYLMGESDLPAPVRPGALPLAVV